MAPIWNRSTEEPTCASDLITVDSCITLLKFNYGEPSENNSTLEFPSGWSKQHFSFLKTRWINKNKLNEKFKFELGINFDVDQNEEHLTLNSQSLNVEDVKEEDDDDSVEIYYGLKNNNDVDVIQDTSVDSGIYDNMEAGEKKKQGRPKRKKSD